jgi:hypothetical protein
VIRPHDPAPLYGGGEKENPQPVCFPAGGAGGSLRLRPVFLQIQLLHGTCRVAMTGLDSYLGSRTLSLYARPESRASWMVQDVETAAQLIDEQTLMFMRAAGFEPLEPYSGVSKPWRCDCMRTQIRARSRSHFNRRPLQAERLPGERPGH